MLSKKISMSLHDGKTFGIDMNNVSRGTEFENNFEKKQTLYSIIKAFSSVTPESINPSE